MTHAIQLVPTMPFWLPGERPQRARTTPHTDLVAEARRGGEPATPEPPRRRSLLPRIADALGLL